MTREVPLVHPGVILMEEWLAPLGISQYALAKGIQVSPRRINDIVHGNRAITPDTALLLGEFFGVDGAGFLNMQTHYDLEMAREKLALKLALVRKHALRQHAVA